MLIHLPGSYLRRSIFSSSCNETPRWRVSCTVPTLNYWLMKLICKPIMMTCQQPHRQVSNRVRQRDASLSAPHCCLAEVFICTQIGDHFLPPCVYHSPSYDWRLKGRIHRVWVHVRLNGWFLAIQLLWEHCQEQNRTNQFYYVLRYIKKTYSLVRNS